MNNSKKPYQAIPIWFKQEIAVLCVGLALLVGAIAFYQTIQLELLLGHLPIDWKWLIPIVAILQLPSAIKILRNKKATWIEKLAQAFSVGFFAVITSGPKILKGLMKLVSYEKIESDEDKS